VLILNRGRVIAEGTVSEIVRRAAAPRSGRFRVAPEHAERAVAALACTRGVEEVGRANSQPGWLTVVFAPPLAHTEDGSPNDAVRALIDSGITVLSFELEGARLSTAFLTMTEAA
jgi:ABC-2 type transport system ATP-binding protein